MTTPLRSPRRFPSYSCDRDPQPLFDELDAVLADFGVCLSVKQEERLRRRFARSGYEPRAQAEILVPFANLLLAQRNVQQRLVARVSGDFVLEAPPAPRPATPRPAAAPAPAPTSVWRHPPRSASGDDAIYRLVLLVLMLGTPMLWVTCMSRFEPRSPAPPVRTTQLDRLMLDEETRRYLDEMTRQLERRKLELEIERTRRHVREVK